MASGAERMPLKVTRSIVTAILTGDVEKAPFEAEPVFGLEVPTSLAGVDRSFLMPRNAWSDKESYDQTARSVAEKFRENFKQYAEAEPSLEKAGPSV